MANNGTPAIDFGRPFEALAAFHAKLAVMLSSLERLANHVQGRGNDAAAREGALELMRFFDLAAPAHHQDEERHVFPALRRQGDEAFAAQLELEHREMARRWGEVRATLFDIAYAGWQPGPAAPELAAWRLFAELYRVHMESEDREAFPAARAAIDADAEKVMGAEMARRRGWV